MRTALPVAALSLLCLSGQDRVMPGTLAPRPAGQRAQPGAPAQAKPAPQLPADEDIPTFRGTVQVVLVPTTVTDNKGRTINGLQPQDFVLYDNEKRQAINRDVAFLPLSMVVCIQRSANVDSVLPKIRRMGGVMSDLLIGQDGEAAILSFDHRIEILQEFTNDAAKIDAAIEKLKPGGQNARLNDSVQTAVRMLRQKRDRRKVILLIAETMDKSSEAKVRDVALDLQVHNIDVFTLNMNRLVTRLTEKPDVPRPDPFPPGTRPVAAGRPMDPTSVNQQYGTGGYGVDFVPVVEEIFTAAKAIFVKNPAEVYTRFTGGREYAFTSQNDLERAITAIGAEIRSQYILSYSPNNKMEGGFHKILVEVNRPNLKVRTRPGYWMAAVPN
ncbi:MAG: VWA domain-containing protein [Candidatus Solibacter usitatus]|nr:VWA domain-containing protein [Candidatus Solibacter usitatus]